MRKLALSVFALLLGLSQAFSQTDAFAGKWNITFIGTPNGDAKMVAEITRESGDLHCVLISEESAEPIEVSEITENVDKITLYFSAQGYDVNVTLNKVDENNLKGSLMGMFDAIATRIVEKKDFFAGNWELLFIGTPNGDAKLKAELSREDGILAGMILADAEPIEISEISEEEDKITLYFHIQGYDVNVTLTKVDDDSLKGSLMGMFDATAKRIK